MSCRPAARPLTRATRAKVFRHLIRSARSGFCSRGERPHRYRRVRGAGDANPDTYSNSYGDSYSYCYVYAYTYAHTVADPDTGAKSDAHTFTQSYTFAYPYGDGNGDTYTGGRDLECNRQPHRWTLWIHGDIAV